MNQIQSGYVDDKLKYRLGDVTMSGEKIESIISSNSKVIVYNSERGAVCYEFAGIEVNESIVQSEYNRVLNTIPAWVDDDLYETIAHELAIALFAGLNCTNDEDAKSYLLAEEKNIKKLKSPLAFKLHFIIANFICCICLVLSCSLIYYLSDEYKEWTNILLCIAAGSIGSLFSLLQRGKDISTEIADKDLYIIIQAVIHNFFGALAGGILFLACMGNLVLGLFYDDIYALLTMSIIAGFSERFVPDLLNKIVEKEKKAAN